MGAERLTADSPPPAGRLRRLIAVFQRVMMRTDRGPLRSLWDLAYRAATRCYVAYLRHGEVGAAAYLRGSLARGGFLHGVSDIDIVIVLAPDPAGPGVARERVRRRCRRVNRALPVLGSLLFDWPAIYEDADIEDASTDSTLTYRLARSPGQARRHAMYAGPTADDDKIRLAERPQLYGPMHDWRPIAGPDRRPPPPILDADSRRAAAWLELQYWWQWAFAACLDPAVPHAANLCVKLIAEPVRIWLWLARGEHVASRAEALERGAAELPEEAGAFELARVLQARLAELPPPPLTDAIPTLVRLSRVIAAELESQAEAAGSAEVRLDWSGDAPLALPHSGWAPAQPTRWDAPRPTLLPLVDWRALAMPSLPDDTFALIDGDPGDPGTLAEAAAALDRGTYPTLSADGLQIRPVPMTGRRRLRTIQCPATDPVSFALADGRSVARYPELAGLSLRDTAARAVAEHAVWLAGDARGDREVLGRLITAARAALLWESVEAGEPELPLTVEATLDTLAARGAAPAADAAREGYHEFAVFWRPPPATLVEALQGAVAALPAYSPSAQKAGLAR